MIQRIILKFCGYVGCDDATNVSNFGYEPIKFSSFMLNIRMHTMQILGLWLRLECSLDSLSIVSTDHQIDRGLSVSLRLYEMCHVLVIV